jgi:hypothetical protein
MAPFGPNFFQRCRVAAGCVATGLQFLSTSILKYKALNEFKFAVRKKLMHILYGLETNFGCPHDRREAGRYPAPTATIPGSQFYLCAGCFTPEGPEGQRRLFDF